MRHIRLLPLLVGAVVTLGGLPALDAQAATTPIVGSLGRCTTAKGALVAVSFAPWSGPIVRGCDPAPTTGSKLLTTAGFTTTGTRHDGPQFICRIGHPRFDGGAQRPTPAQDPCVVTPPTTAYWSYWLAPKGKNVWTYSTLGNYSDRPANGEVEAWVYGATNTAGTTGRPTFTPNQIRAGLPAGTAAASSRTAHRRVAAPHAAATPDLDAGAGYLVDNLVDGHYYDPFGIGFADYGLTMDGVLALAATGNRDPALRGVVDFLAHGGTDTQGRSVDDYTGIGTAYASAGSIGKEALVAEATGFDPRDFGGHDLIHELDGLVCTAADATVCAAPGNYRYASSTFSQTLAILAQLRSGDTAGAARPIAYLESLQQASGAFPSVLPGGDAETDSTGMAAMGLALVPTSAARTAVAKALRWLAGQQAADGGFPGAAGNSVNSAAIAVQALRLDAGTYTVQIAKAERFLAAQQNSDGGFTVAADSQPGSDVRASAQAVGGAVGTPFGSLLDHLPAKAAARDGADYLVAHLTDGEYLSGFSDTYSTSVGVLALVSVGGHATQVSAMTTWLEGQIRLDNGGGALDALVAEATGRDPHHFGGVDVLARLREFRDFDSVTDAGTLGGFVLAFNASSVAADHLGPDSPAVVRLHELQCADGGFRSAARYDDAPACHSDLDSTAAAVQALATVPGTDEWLGAAQSYLEASEYVDGSFSGGEYPSESSTSGVLALSTLVDSLSAPTADPPQPKTLAPITALQSALSFLTTLAAPDGGFYRDLDDPNYELEFTPRAVLGAAQHTLLDLTGATIRSLPRTPATAPGATAPTTTPTPTSAQAPQGGATDPAIAATGPQTAGHLELAALLLALGLLLAYAGRRRVVTARHRLR